MPNQKNLASESRTRHDSAEVSPFDELAAIYDAWFEREGRTIFAIEVQAFQEVLSSLPKPWLEIGVGSGRFAQALGIEVGVDPAFRLVEMARRRGIITFLGKGEQELFDDESFGTVFLITTLGFVDSPLAVLKEAYRILEPGGKIVLGLVLKESPWGRRYQQKKKQGHRFYKHAQLYSYNETADLLEQAGFSTEKIISTLFQKPGEVERMELPRQGYSADAGFTIVVAGKPASNDQRQDSNDDSELGRKES